jgi:hypothetical protein
MNDHLKPVFDLLLPELGKAGVDYWVYGGVSIAAHAGKFIRENGDVDVFVKDEDFGKARLLLEDLCSRAGFKKRYYPPTAVGKPKLDIKVNNQKVFSIISVYPQEDYVEFKYTGGNEQYPKEILQRVERNISGLRFFTAPNELIKKMFIKHMQSKRGKINRPNFMSDAEAICRPDELAELLRSTSD